MFVDSHAHLDGKQFDSDREQVIERARAAGVRTMVAIGNGDGPPQLDAGVQLAEKYPFMYATIGVHPHEARLATGGFTKTNSTASRWGKLTNHFIISGTVDETQREGEGVIRIGFDD